MPVRRGEGKGEKRMRHKVLVSIVNKGEARKLVRSTLRAGAEGGTVLFGEGTGPRDVRSLLGIPLERENEVVFTLVEEVKAHAVLDSALASCRLDSPGRGVAFIAGVKGVEGISHASGTGGHIREETGGAAMNEASSMPYDLIITIVGKGEADIVVDASRSAGAEGGTILFGRGSGVHEKAKLLGIPVEPEKELVMTLVDRGKTEGVLKAIVREAGLDHPGRGIAFVLEVERVAGICHMPGS